MESTHSSLYKEKKIRELLNDRIKKLGSIRTNDAWLICKSYYPYDLIQFHFKKIMNELVEKDKADFIRNGLWFIHKN